mmetsp:Transcript_69241/g.218800  ORF Transcript_69241/g.218800 Transcript_69241/m.218800 type:complete len:335 (+) Transcript_69241:116-1120(+)
MSCGLPTGRQLPEGLCRRNSAAVVPLRHGGRRPSGRTRPMSSPPSRARRRRSRGGTFPAETGAPGRTRKENAAGSARPAAAVWGRAAVGGRSPGARPAMRGKPRGPADLGEATGVRVAGRGAVNHPSDSALLLRARLPGALAGQCGQSPPARLAAVTARCRPCARWTTRATEARALVGASSRQGTAATAKAARGTAAGFRSGAPPLQTEAPVAPVSQSLMQSQTARQSQGVMRPAMAVGPRLPRARPAVSWLRAFRPPAPRGSSTSQCLPLAMPPRPCLLWRRRPHPVSLLVSTPRMVLHCRCQRSTQARTSTKKPLWMMLMRTSACCSFRRSS